MISPEKSYHFLIEVTKNLYKNLDYKVVKKDMD